MRQESEVVAWSYVPRPVAIQPTANAHARDREREPHEVLDALNVRPVSMASEPRKVARI